MKAAQLRAELLKVLDAAQQPITTTEARLTIARGLEGQDRPVVAEQVYRALVVLQRRGVVRRVEENSRRDAQWELVMLFADIPGALRSGPAASARGGVSR